MVRDRSEGTECRTNERQQILVVDDDHDMQRILDDTLDPESFDTIVVTDEDSALALLETAQPDLVILDSATPDTGSLQILDHMREHSDVPIIMLTADYQIESLRKALFRGADDYIRKPFGTRSFVARINAKLRRTRPNAISVH
jgi:DNA-binding response OmpR family regulator